MIAPFAVATALVTIRDGFLPPEYQNIYFFEYLSLRWYWHWYVILALVYLIVLLFFVAPAENRANLQNQRERNDEKLRRYRRQLERSLAPAGAPRELSLDDLRKTYELVPLQPNVVHPFDGSVEDVHEKDHGVIARGHVENGKNFRAIIATYKNEPDTRSKRRIIGINNVTAEVSYVCFDGNFVRQHHGAWLSEKDRKVGFEVSGRHDLVIATIENDHVYAVERETTGIDPNGVTNRTNLTADLYKLSIRLIDAFGAILDDYEMMLTVSREPEFKIELISAKYWMRFRLHELQLEGRRLLTAAYNITLEIQKQSLEAFEAGETDVAAINQRERETRDKEEPPLAAAAKEWETRVGEFVGTHLSEKEKESFINAKPSIDDGLNRVNKGRVLALPGEKHSFEPYWTLIDSLKAREERLEAISSKH